MSTTQWLTLGSIIVGLIGIYYKREEIKAAMKPSVRWEFTPAEKQEPTIPPVVHRGCCQME